MVNTDAWECSHETFYSSNIAANGKKDYFEWFFKTSSYTKISVSTVYGSDHCE